MVVHSMKMKLLPSPISGIVKNMQSSVVEAVGDKPPPFSVVA